MFNTIKRLFGMSTMSNQILWSRIKSERLVQAGDHNLIQRIIKNTGWTYSKTYDALEAYRKFLYLAAINK